MTKSIVIAPPVAIMHFVDKLKKLLYDEIGWYHSVNAPATLNISNFEAGLYYSTLWQRKLERFCAQSNPFKVHFDRVGCFEDSGTVYLALDKASLDTTINFMDAFHKGAKDLKATSAYMPHMTIARGLNDEQLKKAMALLAHVTIDLSFECDQICIRQLDERRQQYGFEKSYSFGRANTPSIFHPKTLLLF